MTKKDYNIQWKLKNKDRVKAYAEKYRANNKEEISIKMKEWQERNREKVNRKNLERYHASDKEPRRQYNKIYRERHKEKMNQQAKDWVLKNRYGLTREEYDILLQKQQYNCAICKKHRQEFNQDFAVDHCHKTNKIRGLLCVGCNTGLGSLKDSVDNLEQAIVYLKKSS